MLIPTQKVGKTKKKGEHGYEKAKHYHQYYDDGDVHVDSAHVHDLLRLYFRCTPTKRVTPCAA